ncbi:MAG: TIGR04255 family protein [Cyanobacteria bacterium]|nr:TIGR04255 family protein [Cyanobacteriota bacterium]
MAKGTATKKNKADEIPSLNALKVINPLLSEVIEEQRPMLVASFVEGAVPDNIEFVIRGTVIQALYSIDGSHHLIEHIYYNRLFQWFLNLENSLETWDRSAYDETFETLRNSHALRRFIEALLAQFNYSESPTHLTIFKELTRWMYRHCPKEIYFSQMANAPLISTALTLVYKEEFENMFPAHIFYEHGGEFFPNEYTSEDRLNMFQPDDEEAYEDLLMHDTSTDFYADDEKHLVRVSSTCLKIQKKAPYDNWDSFKIHIDNAISVCERIYNKGRLKALLLSFYNKFTLPAGDDLSDYMHFIPTKPPPVQVPLFMKEKGLRYEFPSRLTSHKANTHLMYDDEPILLSIEIEAGHFTEGVIPHDLIEDLPITLKLEAYWSQELRLDQVADIATNLREKSYIAFHTLITDKARELFD